jgi:hypothetical protein
MHAGESAAQNALGGSTTSATTPVAASINTSLSPTYQHSVSFYETLWDLTVKHSPAYARRPAPLAISEPAPGTRRAVVLSQDTEWLAEIERSTVLLLCGKHRNRV